MGGTEESPRAELRKRALWDRQPFSNAAGQERYKSKEMHRTTAKQADRIVITALVERVGDSNTKG